MYQEVKDDDGVYTIQNWGEDDENVYGTRYSLSIEENMNRFQRIFSIETYTVWGYAGFINDYAEPRWYTGTNPDGTPYNAVVMYATFFNINKPVKNQAGEIKSYVMTTFEITIEVQNKYKPNFVFGFPGLGKCAVRFNVLSQTGHNGDPPK